MGLRSDFQDETDYPGGQGDMRHGGTDRPLIGGSIATGADGVPKPTHDVDGNDPKTRRRARLWADFLDLVSRRAG